MELKICRSCKKMFQYISGPETCEKCKQLEEEMFQKVKDYLRENPGAVLYEVNKETGVSAKLIEKFLRQGRLEVAPDSPMALSCERCGKKVSTGRFCSACKNEVSNKLDEVKKSLIKETTSKDNTSARMRFLQSNKTK